MHICWRECRDTYRDVLRCFIGSGILDPFAGMSDYGLAGRYIERSTFVHHVELAPNHNGVLLELRSLSRLLPSRGAAHVGNAEAISFRIYAAKKLVNMFRHVAGSLDARGVFNVSRQEIVLLLSVRLHRFELEIRHGKKRAQDEISAAAHGDNEWDSSQHQQHSTCHGIE